MPTDENRINTLRERVAARNEKLENLVAVQRARALNQADEAAIVELAAELAKKVANRRRIDDNRVKTLIGVAALQLPTPTLLRTMRVLHVLLKGRDQDFIKKWFLGRGMDITGPTTEVIPIEEPPSTSNNAAATSTPTALASTIGTILIKVIGKLDEGAFGLVGPEILDGAEEEDRRALEEWYAKLDSDRQALKKHAGSSQDRQASPKETESGLDQEAKRRGAEDNENRQAPRDGAVSNINTP